MATRNEPDMQRPDRQPDDRPRKHAHPLIWLLVLLALLAFGWSFYNHRAGDMKPAPIAPDAAPKVDPHAPSNPAQTQAPASTQPSTAG